MSEAHRIRLAHLFEPVLAVHTSVVEPLPSKRYFENAAAYDAAWKEAEDDLRPSNY